MRQSSVCAVCWLNSCSYITSCACAMNVSMLPIGERKKATVFVKAASVTCGVGLLGFGVSLSPGRSIGKCCDGAWLEITI